MSEISPKRDIACHEETIENLENRGNFPESCPLINYWKFNEIRKYNHKHSNVSQHMALYGLIVLTESSTW